MIRGRGDNVTNVNLQLMNMAQVTDPNVIARTTMATGSILPTIERISWAFLSRHWFTCAEVV
jgi:hypothetical protein